MQHRKYLQDAETLRSEWPTSSETFFQRSTGRVGLISLGNLVKGAADQARTG